LRHDARSRGSLILQGAEPIHHHAGATVGPFVPDLLFALLASFNTLRLIRHVLWRDELQAYMLGAASATPLELFAKLKYEGHPGLWHLLLWVLTRFSTDPVWMQVAHLAIALGVWVLIWRLSPFGTIEKFLLLLSYYLFWEYFIVSRSYALGVLLGFGFIALRIHRREFRFWPWLLLGLLANTSVFGTIWSLGLASFYAGQNWRTWRVLLPGVVAYALLVALAVATMIPAPDALLSHSASPDFSQRRLDMPLWYLLGAFLPFVSPFVADTLNWIGGPASTLATTSFGADPAGTLFRSLGGGSESLLLALLVFSLPVAMCFAIVRDWLRTAEFAAIYFGIILFAVLWSFSGGPRHQGYVFIALVGTIWAARSARPATPVAPVWLVLLALNALGGLTTLSAELRPFSQSYNAARWLERHHDEDAFLIGVRDANTSPIAGYLGRPLYYLECECFGTNVVWSKRRKRNLKPEDVITRIARGMTKEDKTEAILISSEPYDPSGQAMVPELSFEKIKQFPSAVSKETYVIYRVSKRSG
jgi:hypothetical protein